MKTFPVETAEVSPAGAFAMLIHEAVVPGPYYDSVGVLTCYVGHTAAAGHPLPASLPMAMPTTPEELEAAVRVALRVFDADMEVYAEQVRRALRGMLVTQEQFDAAVGAAQRDAATIAGDTQTFAASAAVAVATGAASPAEVGDAANHFGNAVGAYASAHADNVAAAGLNWALDEFGYN